MSNNTLIPARTSYATTWSAYQLEAAALQMGAKYLYAAPVPQSNGEPDSTARIAIKDTDSSLLFFRDLQGNGKYYATRLVDCSGSLPRTSVSKVRMAQMNKRVKAALIEFNQ